MAVPPLITGVPGQASPQASTLPLQIVEADGTITVPYVGRVRIAGRTPAQAATIIQSGLDKETVRPQVVVSLVNNVANTVSVGGEVNKASLMPLTLRGERLLDAVALGRRSEMAGYPDRCAPDERGCRCFGPLRQGHGQSGGQCCCPAERQHHAGSQSRTYVVMGRHESLSLHLRLRKVTLAEGPGAGRRRHRHDQQLARGVPLQE